MRTFSAQFAIDNGTFGTDNFTSACTGGAQPPVARARAPVCPSLATPLAACASQPRYGGDYTQQHPNPIQITAYLQQTVNFDGILSVDSKVCKLCYYFHWRVLQQQNATQPTPVSTLHDIAFRLEEKIVQFEGSNNDLITDKEYLGWVVCKIALQLVKILQQDEAILLPEVYSDFCQLVSTSIENFPNVQKSLKTNPPTNRWLLSSISNHLRENLGIVCKHFCTEKMGTY